MIRKIFKTGHSVAVTLSGSALKVLGLKVGDSVKIEAGEIKGQIIIRQGKRDNQLDLGLKVRPSLK